jgi:uncharacterized protein
MQKAPNNELAALVRAHRDNILALAAQYGASNVRIFGSLARGEANSDSDVDLLIALDDDRSLLDLIGLSQDLEDLLGRSVDLVTERGLNPRLRERVLDEAMAL